MVRTTKIIGLVLTLLLASLYATAQEKQKDPEYHSRVRLVEITVTAKDAGNHHVTDLQESEFRVSAAGRDRRLMVFEPVTVGLDRFGALKQIGVDYAEQQTAAGAESYPPRYFLLFFHQIKFKLEAFNRARDTATEFVEKHMLPNDYISVVGFDKKVDFELDFTNDKSKVLAALADMRLTHRNIKMTDEFYAWLQEFSYKAARMPHKVNIILIAEGMTGVGGAIKYAVYDNTIRMLQTADVRVFGIDVGGLNLRDPGASIARIGHLDNVVNQSFMLGAYAEPTGGSYYRYHNNILNLFEQVDYEMSAYYLLGFYLDDTDSLDEEYHISVETTRPGVHLLYKNRFKPSRVINMDTTKLP